MSLEGFIPLSNMLGIPGSSYSLQMGKVNEKWAIRMVKGNEVLESKIFDDTNECPNANSIVAWVLQVLVIPNLNPYQIAKSVGFIRQEAIRRNEELKKKPTIPVEETKEVKLEQLPEEIKEKREIEKSKQVGWVKEEAPAHVISQTEVKSSDSKVPKSTEEDLSKGTASIRVLPKVPKTETTSTISVSKSSEEGTYTIKIPKGAKKLIIEFE